MSACVVGARVPPIVPSKQFRVESNPLLENARLSPFVPLLTHTLFIILLPILSSKRSVKGSSFDADLLLQLFHLCSQRVLVGEASSRV